MEGSVDTGPTPSTGLKSSPDVDMRHKVARPARSDEKTMWRLSSVQAGFPQMKRLSKVRRLGSPPLLDPIKRSPEMNDARPVDLMKLMFFPSGEKAGERSWYSFGGHERGFVVESES